MEFRLLGSLEASEAGRPIPLGGPKQRAVLAHLLLRANQTVATDRLIDAVWGDDPPAAARSTLQGYVSHLRTAVGVGRLEGRSSGYVLRTDPSEVDALRFEALVERGRAVLGSDPAGAVRLFGEALGLWRGPALDDLARQPSLRAEAARLEELRVAVVEERVAAELDLCRHRELVPELETLVGAHPLRERLWEQLMVALYRSGRQGDALVAYQRARELLAEELGIDPSPQLRRLQEQVLRQDPALEVVGEPLRGYRLLEQVGAGFFGVVHRAFQPQVGREVAVKTSHPR